MTEDQADERSIVEKQTVVLGMWLQRIEDKLDKLLAQTAKKPKKNTAQTFGEAANLITGAVITDLKDEYLSYEQGLGDGDKSGMAAIGWSVGGEPTPVDPETGEILWPGWFSLGYELKGWKIGFAVAEAWRVKNEFTEAYCLDKVYVVRGQWKGAKDSRDPYMVFQRACREDWGGGAQGKLAQANDGSKYLRDYQKYRGHDPSQFQPGHEKYERDYESRWGKE